MFMSNSVFNRMKKEIEVQIRPIKLYSINGLMTLMFLKGVKMTSFDLFLRKGDSHFRITFDKTQM